MTTILGCVANVPTPVTLRDLIGVHVTTNLGCVATLLT
jgi:hypothetical protein